ncbi:MAG: DUF2357 domain-containing protein [Firmicutes bacterium]|nr:DUF2357 domain-containing protein [Bacillota bacterium]
MVEFHGQEIHPLFFEQTNYEFILEKKEGCTKRLYVDHLNQKIREAISPVGKSGRIQTGIINFQDEVGFSKFTVYGDDDKLIAFEIEVYPSKLDYRRDYIRLLQEVNEEVYNLAYAFLLRTSLYAGLKWEKVPSAAEFFAIFQVVRESFFQALEQLKKRPHHKIIAVDCFVVPEKAKRAGRKTVRWLQKRSQFFAKDEFGLIAVGNCTYTPRMVLDTRKELTYDTYENRFLKWMLQQLTLKLNSFKQQYCERVKNWDARVINEIEKATKFIQHFIGRGFLQHVGELKRVEHSSLVMQMAPGYRDVYRSYLMLLKGLHISSDLFSISQKGLAQLYEYWCFLKLNSILRKKYQLKSNDLIKVDRSGITVTLKKGQESKMQYINPRNGEKFTVTYNCSYINLPTIKQEPDNVLKIEKSGSKVQYHYIFDAKYRICVDKDYIKRFKQPGPPEDTINAMHRYRDAIVSQQNINRNIFAAFVLFPHNDEMAYAGKKGGNPAKFFESIERVGIGALPFLPGQTKLVENLLDELILETPESAFERTVLQEGTVEYLTRNQKQNVLIGPLRRKDQLDQCLRHKMYYTYFNEVKSYLNEIEYVAIYQSKRLFKNESEQGIFYYGRIKDYEILQRKDISEAPNGSFPQALAVRFNIEDWKVRKNPIKPKGYGPAEPQRTSWDLFQEATLYPELHLDGVEIRLWRELRRVQDCVSINFKKEQLRESDQMSSMEFPGLLLERLDEKKFKVTVGGESRNFDFSLLNKRPAKVLRAIIAFWQNGLNKISRK